MCKISGPCASILCRLTICNMKKTIILMAAMTVAATLQAQEHAPYSFTAEAGIGITHFINQPVLSLSTDATPQYSALTPTVMVGLSNGGNTFGLRYGLTSVRTPSTSMREVANLHETSILYQRTVELAPRVELFGGVSAGIAIADNELDLNGERRSVYRYGLTLGAEMGLRYRISEWISLYASVGVGYTHLSGGKVDLPGDFAKQVHGAAALVRTTGGIRIGIPPKKRALHMPAELVRNSLPLQLAHYEE